MNKSGKWRAKISYPHFLKFLLPWKERPITVDNESINIKNYWKHHHHYGRINEHPSRIGREEPIIVN